MPLIAVVNKKGCLLPRTLAKVCGNASPTCPYSNTCFSSCCACSMWLFCQLTVNACQSRSDGQLAIHSAKPESTESIHSLGQAGIHPFTHSGIHSFNHSVSHLACYAVSPPPSEFRTHCSRSLAICATWWQSSEQICNLLRVASCQSQCLSFIIMWHPLLAVACCEFNDAAHSTVIKSVWHFNLKAATFHMPHAAACNNKRAHYKEL